MNDKNMINTIATCLMRDIEVAYGYAHPVKTQQKFEYLQPHYADSRDENLIDRLVSAYNCLGQDEQAVFRAALHEALERCIADYSGSVSRLIALLELNHRLNREALSSSIWSRLLACQDNQDAEIAAALLERLIGKFKDWGLQPEIRTLEWRRILSRVSIAALPDMGEWLLKLAKQEPGLSLDIYSVILARMEVDREALRQYWPERDEIHEILFAALLPGLPVHEKAGLLRGHRLPTPDEVASDATDMEGYLRAANDERYSGYSQEERESESKWMQMGEGM